MREGAYRRNIMCMPTQLATATAALLVTLPLAACSIDVEKHDGGRRAKVDIWTPAGALAVRTAVPGEGTGLDVYPGAWPAEKHHAQESADVDLHTAWFGLKVVAAKYETDDSPERVLAFYRERMQQLGDVVECRGNVDFKWRDGARRPVCRERGRSREVKLVSGTEHRQRIVSVKPDGDGSEFALVYVATDK